MSEKTAQDISFGVKASGVPEYLKVNGKPFYIAPHQTGHEGEELLGALRIVARLVLDLEAEPADDQDPDREGRCPRGRRQRCRLIDGVWVCA